MKLTLADFPGAFAAVHDGRPPYLWQTRLLAEVAERGWPRVIAAPTGAGKTAVLDVALFHLALELAQGGPRRAPMRIVFAVDRRVIVDQAHDHAMRIAHKLQDDPALRAMADVLRGDAATALHVSELRGGLPREDDWARSPAQPTVLCTTVDQLGSRLLFRGYGVSESMAPIHAGLLGEDALLLLDEAHLSRPFSETLEAIARHRAASPLGLPWWHCELTATPRANPGTTSSFVLSNEERGEPAIRQRLVAGKIADLETTKADPATLEHIHALKAAALRLCEAYRLNAPTIAVIVNRVALARAVHAALAPPEGMDNPPHEAILLTGRVRPAERDVFIESYRARLETLDSVETKTKPLFVIATQCIEAGADYSFDAMVTQLAPLDALRQRFGRLNRRGARAEARAVVLASAEELKAKYDDPLYRDRLKPTWDWLLSRATAARGKAFPFLSVSPEAFARAEAEDAVGMAGLAVASPAAPVLRAADIAFFATTNPAPHPDPYLPLFLHGPAEDVADVAIVWRADVTERELAEAGKSDLALDRLIDLLALLPPRAGEALRLPLWTVRAWLRQADRIADLSDSDGEVPTPAEELRGRGRPALRWRGEKSMVSFAADLRPGDTIVVPTAYGGCDRYGWAHDSSAPVTDIADLASRPYARRYAALRLHPSLLEARVWSAVLECLDAGIRDAEDVCQCAAKNGVFGAELLRGAAGLRLEFPYDDEDGPHRGVVIVAPRGVAKTMAAPLYGKAGDHAGGGSTEDDSSSLDGHGERVELAAHVAAVAETVDAFARRLGLSAPWRAALAFAATHHDDGKLDPRFQDYLAGPNAAPMQPLAKSGRRLGPGARDAAGLPKHWRHEVLSVRAAMARLPDIPDDIDADLALFLIGTHHGQGRPFFRHDDPWDAHGHTIGGEALPLGPGPERLDFDWRGRDWAELFAALQARHGAWGLAFLEAVLRLADHRASEAAP